MGLGVRRIAVGSVLIVCLAAVQAAADARVPVLPYGYRFGTIPVNAPYNYLTYAYSAGSLAEITDGSQATYATAQGLDAARQSNNAIVDTGTFYLLQYQIDPTATSFRIDFTARIEDYPFTPFGDFQVHGTSPDGNTLRECVWQVHARQPTTFGVEFFRNSNTGTHPDGVGWGLNSFMGADGRFIITLNGVFQAGIDQPGRVTSYLYDISASYAVVPEPDAALVICLLAFVGPRRRRKRRPALAHH